MQRTQDTATDDEILDLELPPVLDRRRTNPEEVAGPVTTPKKESEAVIRDDPKERES